MRKPVFPRILLFILLYFVVFTVLVYIQFSKQGSFTQRVGSFVVSGQQRQLPAGNQDEDELSIGGNEYLLEGNTHVFFGGIDFCLVLNEGGVSLMLVLPDGTKEEALPERMVVQGEAVVFTFPGGVTLEFSSQYVGGAISLLISGTFSDDVAGIELPFRLQRKAGMRDTGDGNFIVSSDRVNYTFDRSRTDTPVLDAEAKLIFIRAGGVPVSYRAIPERKGFSPDNFILPQALTDLAYNEAIARWRDQNFSAWNRTISDQIDEDTITAFITEALARGTYKAAITAVPSAFLRSDNRGYESSSFLGGLEQASRSISSREREKNARLSRLINDKSLEFLKEPRVVEYFALRGQFNMIDAGAELIRAIDPAILALDITPGILEGFMDWNTYRPNTENPFERVVDQACFVISESLHKTTDAPGNLAGGRVFAFSGSQTAAETNLRLGKALLEYAESIEDSSWTGIGRSLILSALATDDVPGAALYRILNPASLFPRALSVVPSGNIWAWTVAQNVSAVQRNDVMDITVRFPAGETHFMMIRGIRPFARIQLYGMDFRTDPQFERYDSSGWAYNSQDQTLLLKMRHRTAEEQVRIIFREAPGPAVEPAAATVQTPAQETASGSASSGVMSPGSAAPQSPSALTPAPQQPATPASPVTPSAPAQDSSGFVSPGSSAPPQPAPPPPQPATPSAPQPAPPPPVPQSPPGSYLPGPWN